MQGRNGIGLQCVCAVIGAERGVEADSKSSWFSDVQQGNYPKLDAKQAAIENKPYAVFRHFSSQNKGIHL